MGDSRIFATDLGRVYRGEQGAWWFRDYVQRDYYPAGVEADDIDEAVGGALVELALGQWLPRLPAPPERAS